MATAAGDAPASSRAGGPAMDAESVAAVLAERAEQARAAAADAGAAGAVPPASRWHWPSIAAVAVPALALILIVSL
jgi:hypothetical protein